MLETLWLSWTLSFITVSLTIWLWEWLQHNNRLPIWPLLRDNAIGSTIGIGIAAVLLMLLKKLLGI